MRSRLFLTFVFMIGLLALLTVLMPARALQAATATLSYATYTPYASATYTVTPVPSITPIPPTAGSPTITLTPSITPTSSGQILIVTKLNDTNDGICDGDCSLREAISAAPWGATVNFAPNVTGTIALNSSLQINKSLTINGPGPKSSALIIDGTHTDQIFIINSGKTVVISKLTIVNGLAGSIGNYGGTLTVTYTTFQGNFSATGGAISNTGGGVLTVIGSTFQGNKATEGGAIDNDYGGIASIINSTFLGNSATRAAAISNYGSMTITNSTIQGKAGDSEATISNIGPSTLTIRNTIIIGNPNGCEGAITDGSHNLQYPSADCGTNIRVADPQLGPLQDNGGATWTMALQTGSPAIDSGDNTICATIQNLDQRGMTRTASGTGNTICDIGAFEYNALP